MGNLVSDNNTVNENPADMQDYCDVDAGAVIQRAREHYGLTLDDVEKHLHIRKSYLEAIELNKPDVLPGRVYAIGFIRTYAEFLGLDGGKIIEIYKRHLHEKDRPEFHVPIEASESKLPNTMTLIASALTLVLFITGFVVFQKQQPEITIQKPDTVLNEIEQSKLVPPIDAGFNDFVNIEPAAGMLVLDEVMIEDKPSRIVIYAQESAWVEIVKGNGEEIISKVLTPGDRYDVPDQPDLYLNTGNIGGLVMTLDGHDLESFGESGDKLRNFHLTPVKLDPYLKISGN